MIDMLLGLLRPDAGSVSVFGMSPPKAIEAGAIGAMLQTGAVLRDRAPPRVRGGDAHLGAGLAALLLPRLRLVYLGQTVQGVANTSQGLGAIVGYVLVALFAVTYLLALPIGWNGGGRL